MVEPDGPAGVESSKSCSSRATNTAYAVSSLVTDARGKDVIDRNRGQHHPGTVDDGCCDVLRTEIVDCGQRRSLPGGNRQAPQPSPTLS